jgi:hypothetical protein
MSRISRARGRPGSRRRRTTSATSPGRAPRPATSISARVQDRRHGPPPPRRASTPSLPDYDSVCEARASIGPYLDFYNPASVYVVEEKRLCWSGSDPAGYLEFCRARSAIDRAADDDVSAARAKIHGPSRRGWIASTSPASAASRRVLGAIRRSFAALIRLSHGSMPSVRAGIGRGGQYCARFCLGCKNSGDDDRDIVATAI